MSNPTANGNETIATYEHDGQTYEIDHLGINYDHQWGNFAVYRDGVMLAEFIIPGHGLNPEYRPTELPATSELIQLAKQAVAEQDE